MIRGGFLSPRQRAELIALLRDGHTEQRLARRANAMLLLDDGWSCERAAQALYLDDDTVRDWRKTYDEAGVEGLRRFEAGGWFLRTPCTLRMRRALSAARRQRRKTWPSRRPRVASASTFTARSISKPARPR